MRAPRTLRATATATAVGLCAATLIGSSAASSAAPAAVGPTASAGAVELSELVLSPGRLGPLVVGSRASKAIKAGLVKRVNRDEDDPCGVDYKSRFPRHFLVEYRSGNNERLNYVFVRSKKIETSRGIKVGSSFTRLEATYGERLTYLGRGAGNERQYGVDGRRGALVFALTEDDKRVFRIIAQRKLTLAFGECAS